VAFIRLPVQGARCSTVSRVRSGRADCGPTSGHLPAETASSD